MHVPTYLLTVVSPTDHLPTLPTTWPGLPEPTCLVPWSTVSRSFPPPVPRPHGTHICGNRTGPFRQHNSLPPPSLTPSRPDTQRLFLARQPGTLPPSHASYRLLPSTLHAASPTSISIGTSTSTSTTPAPTHHQYQCDQYGCPRSGRRPAHTLGEFGLGASCLARMDNCSAEGAPGADYGCAGGLSAIELEGRLSACHDDRGCRRGGHPSRCMAVAGLCRAAGR